jgi:fibrillarin-like pre-rRNA processing protein
MNQIFPGVFRKGRQLFTKSIVRGFSAFSKTVLTVGSDEYREWDPDKSKPAAAIARGLKDFPLKAGDKVLYLGAASGATCSFFSDIIGNSGVIYAVEFSERTAMDLNIISEKRANIIPILADARKPEQYEWVEPVDVLFEDVASDDQSPILIRNAEKFLKPTGTAMIAIKARSIDVTKEPRTVYKEQLAILEKHFKVIEKLELDPFEKDHMFAVLKKR